MAVFSVGGKCQDLPAPEWLPAPLANVTIRCTASIRRTQPTVSRIAESALDGKLQTSSMISPGANEHWPGRSRYAFNERGGGLVLGETVVGCPQGMADPQPEPRQLSLDPFQQAAR
jgi:hypothetical protein